MKTGFFYQTGNFSFQIDLKTPSQINSWVNLKFGSEYLKNSNIDFYFKTGEIYDRNGLYFGSYSTDETVTISGNVHDNGLYYQFNNIPVISNSNIYNQDYDYLEIDSNSNFLANFQIKYKTKERSPILLFISKDLTGSDRFLLDFLLSKKIYNNIEYGYNNYTGILSDDRLNLINSNYSLILFGKNYSIDSLYDKTGWSKVERPIIFMDAFLPSQSGISIISGSKISSNNFEKSWGQKNTGTLSLNQSALDIITKRSEQDFSGFAYKLYEFQNGEYISYSRQSPAEPLLINNSGNSNLILLDLININQSGYNSGQIQSGERIIFNTPLNYGQNISGILTDEFKKIFARYILKIGHL